MKNIDIEYVMNGNDIKENIIVRSKQERYEYKFALTLEGLTPILDNNVIFLTDTETGEVRYSRSVYVRCERRIFL